MSAPGYTRRRVLQIAAVVPLTGLSARAAKAAPVARWRGVALGADAQVLLSGLDRDEAGPVFATIRDEIARLEGIFSLYLPNSSLSRLNGQGQLAAPDPELLEVLSLARAVWNASQGAFDPAVQPLWSARARGEQAPDWADFGTIQVSPDRITLKPGQALTLNGIAQGYITDKVARLLRSQGLRDVMVDAGEQRALGQRPGGGPWRIGIAGPEGQVMSRLSLQDRALATSASLGSRLDAENGHIIDARTGLSVSRWKIVSVTHDTAALADALSTAACCLSADETDAMLIQFPEAGLAYRA